MNNDQPEGPLLRRLREQQQLQDWRELRRGVADDLESLEQRLDLLEQVARQIRSDISAIRARVQGDLR